MNNPTNFFEFSKLSCILGWNLRTIWNSNFSNMKELNVDERDHMMNLCNNTTTMTNISKWICTWILGQVMDLNYFNWIFGLVVAKWKGCPITPTHLTDFITYRQTFNLVDENWLRLHFGWGIGARKLSRIEGLTHFCTHFVVIHSRATFPIAYGVKHLKLLGSILTQLDNDGWKFVEVYVNWFNNKKEAKYSSFEGECLVVLVVLSF
jgi:hypothetical protein